MSSRYEEIGLVNDPVVQGVLQKMAQDLDTLMGTYPGLSSLPTTPYEGQVERFAAGVAGSAAGLYERRSGVWSKL